MILNGPGKISIMVGGQVVGIPIPNGTLTFDELLDEAMDGKSVEPSITEALPDYVNMLIGNVFITT